MDQPVVSRIETGIGWLNAYVPAVLWPWIILGLGILGAVLTHALLWQVVSRIAAGRSGLVFQVVRRLRRPSRLFLIGVTLAALVGIARLDAEWVQLIRQVTVAILMVILGWIALIGIDTAATHTLRNLRLDAEDNLSARKQTTQVRLLQRSAKILVVLLTAGLVLSAFDSVRAYGTSLFASAGAAGIVLGFAARPVLANLIAGVQIALTQPIRIDDVVIVENEWGWIEEIGATYVVVRIWDLRRLIVPLSVFIEQPFQNWTRENASIIGTVFWYVDYTAPVAAIRAKLDEIVRASPLWDGKVVNCQVTDLDKDVVTIRGLMSARNSPIAWDLRCEVREKMLDWLQAEHPDALPKVRGELQVRGDSPAPSAPEHGMAPGSDGPGVPEEAQPAPLAPGASGPHDPRKETRR